MGRYVKPESSIGPVGFCPTCQEDGPCEFHCIRCGLLIDHRATDLYQIRHWVPGRWTPDLGEWQLVSNFCAACWAAL